MESIKEADQDKINEIKTLLRLYNIDISHLNFYVMQWMTVGCVCVFFGCELIYNSADPLSVGATPYFSHDSQGHLVMAMTYGNKSDPKCLLYATKNNYFVAVWCHMLNDVNYQLSYHLSKDNKPIFTTTDVYLFIEKLFNENGFTNS